MKIFEIENYLSNIINESTEDFSLLFEDNVQYDVTNYGVWTVKASQKPVVMGKLTNNKPMYVAMAERKTKKGAEKHIGVGNNQQQATEDALSKAYGDERSADPNDFKSFVADLNVEFTKIMDERYPGYFKFERKGGEVVMVMASAKFYKAFGDEIKSLGFSIARNRQSNKDGFSNSLYGFPVSVRTVKELNMTPNMRYTLTPAGQDSDSNALFILEPLTRVQNKREKFRMGVPGVTLAGTLKDSPGM